MKHFTSGMHLPVKAGFLVFTLSLLITSGCHKKSNDPTPDETGTNVPKGTLMMHLHTYLYDLEVDSYNLLYTTPEGRNIKLTSARLFLSNIELEKLDGSLVSVTGAIILKNIETFIYTVGNVPVGNYKSIRFYVGLDSATNKSTPTTDSPLNNSLMWFGSTAQPDGYVFMNFQGLIDTTTDMSSTQAGMQPFRYLIGTTQNTRQVIMPAKNFTVVEKQIQYVHMTIDYYRLFDGVSLNVSGNLDVVTPTGNASGIAAQIANNIPFMFSYEE